jgi:hypothetical protein
VRRHAALDFSIIANHYNFEQAVIGIQEIK